MGGGGDDSSPNINGLPRAVIKESVRDHGNAKIIDCLRVPQAQGIPFLVTRQTICLKEPLVVEEPGLDLGEALYRDQSWRS
jgi:hypothetical protein